MHQLIRRSRVEYTCLFTCQLLLMYPPLKHKPSFSSTLCSSIDRARDGHPTILQRIFASNLASARFLPFFSWPLLRPCLGCACKLGCCCGEEPFSVRVGTLAVALLVPSTPAPLSCHAIQSSAHSYLRVLPLTLLVPRLCPFVYLHVLPLSILSQVGTT